MESAFMSRKQLEQQRDYQLYRDFGNEATEELDIEHLSNKIVSCEKLITAIVLDDSGKSYIRT